MAVADYFDTIQKIYIAFYQRPADPAGLKYWAQRVDAANGSLAEVIDAFANSAEAAALYGEITGETIGDIVDAIYQALFNRAPDAAGKQFYVDAFNAGEITAGKIALAVLDGSQGDDLVAINNKLAVANIFTAKVDGRPLSDAFFGTGTNFDVTYNGNDDAAAARTILAAVTSNPSTVLNESGVVAALQEKIADAGDAIGGVASGQTFTLTTNQDTLTGTAGNDTFNAGIQLAADGTTEIDTVQSFDSINGGAGTDTLNATINSGAATVTPSLTSVEIVKIRSTKDGSGLNLSGSVGVTTVAVANSTGTADVTGVGAISSFSISDQKKNVTFNDGTATTVALSAKNVGTVSATAPVEVDVNFDDNAFTTANLTVENSNIELLSTTAGNNDLTTVSVAATGSNTVKLTSGAATITAVTVTGAGSVDLSGAALTAAKTLTAADGGVTVDATGGVLETATTGAGKDTITVVGTNVKNISTGAGDDKVNTVTSALAATSVVDLGAGDDTLTLSAASTAGATLTGGDGTDTLAVAYAAYNTISGYGATDLAKITGFEVLSITGAALADTNTVDLSKIAGITSAKILGVTSTEAASITNIGANATVELVGADSANGDLTASLKTDTSADALTLVLNRDFTDNNNTASTATTAATQKVVLADIESLTVKSTGTNTSLPFTPVDGYKADTITNTLDLTGSNKLTGITVTGDQKLVLASTAAMTKLATVDGSANTGGLDFDGSLADMTTPTTSVAMTIKGSATAANTLVGTGHADTIIGGAKADTITGGKGGDTLTGNGGNDKFVFAAGDSAIGTGTFDTITDFVANTWGNGTAGAAGTEADLSDATKVTGDVLSFTKVGSVDATKGFKVFVASSAADATTFLANGASADNTFAYAALDSTTNKLYVDVSGDGVTDFYISLTGVTTITAAAFELV